MTRETKIGLLVGLAFIIVIGILLSEHVSSTNEPQQAALAGAGANVRDGVMTPVGSENDGPPVTIAGAPAGAPADAPRRRVPTHDDLRGSSPPVAFVQVGPGSGARPAGVQPDGSPAPYPDANGLSDSPAGPAPRGVLPQPTPTPLVPNPVDPPTAGLPRGARELVLQHPDDLTPVNPGEPAGPVRSGSGRQGDGASGAAPAAGQTSQYVAVPGDNLSHMASRLMGGNTKANRDLLLRANPSLQADGNPVIAGRSYVIPRPSRGAIAAMPSAAGGPPGAPATGSDPDSGNSTRVSHLDRAEAVQWYTVRGNDNLWKIAEAQLGSGNAWTLIRDINKDILKGGETVHPNMRLRLPAKSAVAGVD